MVSFTAENLVKLLILFYFSQNNTKKNFFAFFVSEIGNFKCIFRCIFCCFIKHKSMHICSFLVHENPGPTNNGLKLTPINPSFSWKFKFAQKIFTLKNLYQRTRFSHKLLIQSIIRYAGIAKLTWWLFSFSSYKMDFSLKYTSLRQPTKLLDELNPVKKRFC